MPRWSEFLDRFRPAGAPGAAAAGVPADRAGAANAELMPVLRQLDEAQAEADRIRADARREAEAIRAAAAAAAAAVLTGARDRCASVTDQARRRTLEAAEAAGDTTNSPDPAAAVGLRAEERMAGFVAAVVATVREQASGGDGAVAAGRSR